MPSSTCLVNVAVDWGVRRFQSLDLRGSGLCLLQRGSRVSERVTQTDRASTPDNWLPEGQDSDAPSGLERVINLSCLSLKWVVMSL